jgi:hypothetical protein
MKLYISCAEGDCASCAESRLYDNFNDGSLIQTKPSKCKFHHRKQSGISPATTLRPSDSPNYAKAGGLGWWSKMDLNPQPHNLQVTRHQAAAAGFPYARTMRPESQRPAPA